MSEADVTSGVPSYGSITTSPFSAFNPVYMTFAALVQDNWKASNRLNVSLGLRWELAPAPTDADGNLPYTVDQISNLATTVLAPQGTKLWKTTYRNFAPRVGLACQLRQRPGWETVVRTGFGIYYDTARADASIGYAGIGYTATSYVGELFFHILPIKSLRRGCLPQLLHTIAWSWGLIRICDSPTLCSGAPRWNSACEAISPSPCPTLEMAAAS